jgi:hypothetical protein
MASIATWWGDTARQVVLVEFMVSEKGNISGIQVTGRKKPRAPRSRGSRPPDRQFLPVDTRKSCAVNRSCTWWQLQSPFMQKELPAHALIISRSFATDFLSPIFRHFSYLCVS